MPRKAGPIVKRPVPNVKKVLAVASGKGGVGKSTIARMCFLPPFFLFESRDSIRLIIVDIYSTFCLLEYMVINFMD